MGPFPPLIQPITANDNDLHMQLLLLAVVCSAALISLHPAGSSNDSDKFDSIQRFWHDFLRGITMAV